MLLGRVQCKDILLESLWICATQTTPGMDGDFIDVVYMVDFWMEGSGPKDIWSKHSCPTGENQKVSSLERLCECLASITLKAMYKAKQHSSICSKVKTLVNSISRNNSTVIYWKN